MQIIRRIVEMKQKIKKIKKDGKKIGIVPTMGYLHEGHISLIEKIKSKVDIIVLSIFVNPKQFGENEDLESYPRNIEKDSKIAEEAGVDFIFYPLEKEMYPNGYQTVINLTELTKGLCGEKRPGHFKGVATVVLKLFNIIKPDFAVFGLKDAQQVRVIEKMQEDLNLDVKIIRAEIIREIDGLAKSSRNKYLNEKERKDALVLRKSLLYAKEIIEAGETSSSIIIKKVEKYITSNYKNINVDYFEIVDFEKLEKIEELHKIHSEILIAMAVYVGNTRLIDNMLLNKY
ncbi:MAG: pantoate--beta-alanine ligase [Fusobacteriia bacterium 4572_132]|nr:MAG: pantoate--beta-alanine ligase [Fusobacteriia bacterium 4572_132]